MNKLLLTIIGAPGSGKGTQARLLSEKHNLKHLEIGGLIREKIKFDIGVQKKYIKGKFQSSKFIHQIIESEINLIKNKRIIIDPFPIRINQITILKKIVKKYNLPNPIVINIKTSKITVLNRILNRKEKRIDDNQATGKYRINEYYKYITQVVERLKKIFRVIDINGNPSIKEVAMEIEKKLKYLW